MTTAPALASVPCRAIAPISLSSALWRPTSSRTKGDALARQQEPGRNGWHGSGHARGLLVAQSIGGASDFGAGKARAVAHQRQRARGSIKAVNSAQPAAHRSGHEAAARGQSLGPGSSRSQKRASSPFGCSASSKPVQLVGRGDNPFGQGKAGGEVLQIGGRGHHDRRRSTRQRPWRPPLPSGKLRCTATVRSDCNRQAGLAAMGARGHHSAAGRMRRACAGLRGVNPPATRSARSRG